MALSARRRLPGVVAWGLLALAMGWVAYKAFGEGFGRASATPTFITVSLNALSLAGLYFITASGFTLIFGLLGSSTWPTGRSTCSAAT